MNLLEELRKVIVELDLEKFYQIFEEVRSSDVDVKSILNTISDAMRIVGEKYEKGEYHIPELVLASEMLKEVNEFLRNRIGKNEKRELKIVLGVVKGDIHDLGKDPHALGLSAFLTTTALEIPSIVKKLEERGLRDRVKIIIGGAAVSEELAKQFKVDAYARDAFEAVEKLKRIFNP
ncbi:MAG: hypothetical protein B6V02_02755 [Thermoprotei archaeon ex4572_64]|nr:MAG: hypothetical protein B6V02_02755 [Thermoprotei archaeon ex4572_64]